MPLKCMHDTVHNIAQGDVKYADGVMLIDVRWSKTNQFHKHSDPSPIVADNNNKFCLVCWLLYMINRIPASPNHNLFCCVGKEQVLLPITYRDLMVTLRNWIKKVGLDEKMFSSHSMRQGATMTVFKKSISDTEIQMLGN